MPQLALFDSCTGCTSCASVCPKGCITMRADSDGFWYPVVDSTACVGCGLCEKVCPILGSSKPAHEPAAWAARSKDTKMRLASSSGGVFTELARYILSMGGAVYGAVYDGHFRVVHGCAEDEAGLARLRGAKYAQSDLDGIFREVRARLERGQQVLFSGTPCQAAGLLAFLRRPYENLTTVDFVCHGVPSPMAWAAYIKSLGDVQSVNLRAKDTGWSRYRYCHRIEIRNGARLIPNGESLYMKLFVGDHINRPSCADCRFKGYARVSDLTIGDFWGIWDIAPEMDDDRGTSLVLVQSPKGAELWESVSPKLTRKPVTPEEASRQNPSLLVSSPPSAQRETVLARIRAGELETCDALLAPQKPTVLQKLRRKLGAIKNRLH